MERDYAVGGWQHRATCRGVSYSLMWAAAIAAGSIACAHPLLQVMGAALALLAGGFLIFTFNTLFEHTFLKMKFAYAPLLLTPYCGALLMIVGELLLMHGSFYIVSNINHQNVRSVEDLASLDQGDGAPMSVCSSDGFVKTNWEQGKLVCQTRGASKTSMSTVCHAEFVVAPIFIDQTTASLAKAELIMGWAVTRGRHVDASYLPTGELCGYIGGVQDLEFHRTDYMLAIMQSIQTYNLGEVPPDARLNPTRLMRAPLLMVTDPWESAGVYQVSLAISAVILLLAPCVSPCMIGGVLVYFCVLRKDAGSKSSGLTSEESDEDGQELIGRYSH
mmetsp:Transcript_5409/g.12925  ORF Transcript_5409/g.12925 Transcript_5409/m.12925 type:complete len:332 (-) Transcript_5409:32-1027(-)